MVGDGELVIGHRLRPVQYKCNLGPRGATSGTVTGSEETIRMASVSGEGKLRLGKGLELNVRFPPSVSGDTIQFEVDRP